MLSSKIIAETKNTWKGINRLIGNESKFNKITQLDTGDTVITDPTEISNILNTHFSKIGPSLASEIKDASSNFTAYITPARQIFKLGEVSCQGVFNLILKIPTVSVKMVGTLWGLLVPSMLVYKIW